MRPWSTCAAVGLAALLALRFAVEVVPAHPGAVTADRVDLSFPKFSDVARVGDSRFISPPDWAARPVAFELWFAYRSATDTLLKAAAGESVPTWHRNLVVYAGWFFLWLMLLGWVSGFYVRGGCGARAASSSFAQRLLVIIAIVYLYCLWATAPMYVPYDLVAATFQLALFALIWAFWDRPSLGTAFAVGLACVVAIFVKESLLMGIIALLVMHLRARARPQWAATSLLLTVSLLTAWGIQDAYIHYVLGDPDMWERSFSYFRGILFSNVLYLLGLTLAPGGLRTALLFVLPLLLVLTPVYRSGLTRDKDRILRLTISLFVCTLLVVGNPRESRIILEFALLAYVFRPLERLGIGASAGDHQGSR